MTPSRYAKIRRVLEMRQLDLTLCLDQVHKPHNISAIIRTCDAVGVHRLHSVWEDGTRIRRGTTKGSHDWVELCPQPDISQAISTVREQGMQVLVTHLSDDAVDYRNIDYTRPTAIVLGQEKYGVSEQGIQQADQAIVVPMMGMVQSLNVSVAAALILYEAQRQRQLSGAYQHQQLPEERIQALIFENCYSRLHQLCVEKGLPYPQIDQNGDVLASDHWWQQMQLTPAAQAGSDE